MLRTMRRPSLMNPKKLEDCSRENIEYKTCLFLTAVEVTTYARWGTLRFLFETAWTLVDDLGCWPWLLNVAGAPGSALSAPSRTTLPTLDAKTLSYIRQDGGTSGYLLCVVYVNCLRRVVYSVLFTLCSLRRVVFSVLFTSGCLRQKQCAGNFSGPS